MATEVTNENGSAVTLNGSVKVKTSDESVKKEAQPNRKAKVDEILGDWSHRRLDALGYLRAVDEWVAKTNTAKDDSSVIGVSGSGRKIRKKEDSYIIEQREEEARKKIIREKNRKRLEEKNKRLEAKRKEMARLQKIEDEKKRKERQALLKEKKKEAERLRRTKAAENEKKRKAAQKEAALKKRRLTPPNSSSSATPDPESSILKSRKAEAKSRLVDGYVPFLQDLIDDHRGPIRRNFFIPEVYEDKTKEVQNVTFTPASETITKYLKKYREYKGIKPQNVSIKSVVYPQFKEEYHLVESKDFELDPLEEIGRLMEAYSVTYFPQEYKLTVYNPKDPYSSLAGKLSKGIETRDEKKVLDTINEYNELVTKIHQDDGFTKHLKKKRIISRAFIHEVLCQTYSRAVSPSVQRLKKYEAFSNYVYGELLPNFLSKVFEQVGLNQNSTFIDLGSGVGNVTIQAALEYGCESYGCEIMENASDLADLQHKVFNERCKYFGLNPGKVKFFNNQSFVNNKDVEEVVDRCDVILVNNFLFSPDLNKEVMKLFQNLKVGTKIISLKNLVPAGYTINGDNIDNKMNFLHVECYPLGNGSVSWTDKGGIYFISEVKDTLNEAYYKRIRRTRTPPNSR